MSSLPQSISRLPVLKILSIRDNEFTEFPDCLTECQSLSCIDLADNKIQCLPQTLLRLKLLKSLQVDGNPLTDPSPEVCEQGLDAIMTELWRMSRKNPESDDYSSNCDIDWRTTVTDSTCDEKENAIEVNIITVNFYCHRLTSILLLSRFPINDLILMPNLMPFHDQFSNS